MSAAGRQDERREGHLVISRVLEANDAGVRRRDRPVHDRSAVHMLRRVFDLAEAAHLIRHRVEGHRLEATPAHGKYERIIGLKDPPVPTMLLELELDVRQHFLERVGLRR